MKKLSTCALALLLAFALLLSVAAPAMAATIPTPTGLKVEFVEDKNNFDYSYFSFEWDKTNASWQSFSGYVIHYSTDKEDWKVATINYNRESYYCSVREFEDGGKPVRGTTYYFKLSYTSYDRQSYGASSNIVSCQFGKPLTAEELDRPQQWEALKKKLDDYQGVKVSYKNYDGATLKKGSKIIYKQLFYTLTVSVTEVKGTKCSFKFSMKSDYDFYVDSTIYLNNHDDYEVKGTAPTQTCKNVDLENGNNIRFSVSSGEKYKNYRYSFEKMKDYNSYSSQLWDLDSDYLNFDYYITELGGKTRKLAKGDAYSTWNSITVSNCYFSFDANVACGTILYWRKQGDSKWKNKVFKNGDSSDKSMTIKKLAANTVYEVRAQDFIKSTASNGQPVTVKSSMSKVLKLRTGAKEKPVITSVKVSNVKHYTQHHNGYWIRNTWEPDVWKPAWDEKRTSYTVTITVKSLPQNAVGVYAGGFAKKGKTISFTSSCTGHVNKVSGQTKVHTYMEYLGKNSYGYAETSGRSPSVTVKYSN